MVEIRAAIPTDAGCLAELCTTLGYPVEAGELASRMARLQGRADLMLAVAEAPPGRPVGLVFACERIGPDLAPLCALVALVVEAAYRRAGVGTALVAAVEDWAAARGLATTVLHSALDRRDAHAFYERLGFSGGKASRRFDRPVGARAAGAGLG